LQRFAVAVAVLAAALLAAPVAWGAPALSKDRPISVGEQVVTLDELEHWARVAARGLGDRTKPEHFREAARLLISNLWIEGEAALQGVTVSDARVDRELREQIRLSFPNRREFRRWLRRSGQTLADVRRRVRIELLINGVRRRVIGDAKTPEGQQRRLDRFLVEFRARWRAQTLCTPRFLELRDECGNAPAPE
jgi:hypothetical protein